MITQDVQVGDMTIVKTCEKCHDAFDAGRHDCWSFGVRIDVLSVAGLVKMTCWMGARFNKKSSPSTAFSGFATLGLTSTYDSAMVSSVMSSTISPCQSCQSINPQEWITINKPKIIGDIPSDSHSSFCVCLSPTGSPNNPHLKDFAAAACSRSKRMRRSFSSRARTCSSMSSSLGSWEIDNDG